MTPETFLSLCLTVGFALIMLSLIVAFMRLAKGPGFADRVVALDMMSVSIVAFCALYAVKTGVGSFLDIASVVALVGFLATVALARFAERGLDQSRTATHPRDAKSPGSDAAHDTEDEVKT